MKVTFLMGAGDVEFEEDVEVTEEEYERLKKALSSGRDFYDCEEVRDIYNRVYDIADEGATETLLANNEDIAEKYKGDKNFKASDLYQIDIQCYEFEPED